LDATRRTRRLLLSSALAALACAPESDRSGGDAATRAASDTTRAAEAACWVSAHSVLGREAATPPGMTSTQQPPPDTLRGWLRLERAGDAEPGEALLLDSDGASLRGTWRPLGADSLVVEGFDDFLRVELRLARDARALAARGLATSDATFDRAADGRLAEYRREWTGRLAPASCDSLPGGG
jgi:hypothetical protein